MTDTRTKPHDVELDVFGHETVDVMGELFFVHDDEELGKLLVRPPWSLMGAGPTVEAARKHLIEEALDLARSIGLDDPKDLTADANEMRNYALKVAAL